jgi:5'-nucleotidase
VTNDDGIDSEGLHVLARRMEDHGDVVVIAPDREYSGASAALGPLHLIRPETQRAHLEGVAEAWAVSGPPGLCVMFGVMGAFGGPFDLVVAGINPGENIGRAVYHSGTVGAAVTARCREVTGVAVSQAVHGPAVEGQGEEDGVVDQHWETAASVAGTVVAGLLHAPPKEAIAVNVNVPNVGIDQLRQWRSTTLATLPARALASATLRSKPGHTGAFRIEMAWGEPSVLGRGTDGGAVAAGEVSVTLLGAYTETDLDGGPGLADALSERWSRTP